MITVEEIKSAIRDREEAMDRLFSTERIITREQSKIEKYVYRALQT